MAVLLDQLDGSKCNEKTLLEPATYGKFCIALDEFISLDGVVEHTDVDTIGRLAKLKHT